MDRLTHQRANGIKTGYWSPAKKDELVDRLAAYENTDLTPEEIKEVKKYKDLEEQGLPFRPICKVGDTIYLVPSKANFALNVLNRNFENNRVKKRVVNEIRILKDDCMYVTYDEMFGMLQSYFGETWFLTEEEAEAKLEELRGEKD